VRSTAGPSKPSATRSRRAPDRRRLPPGRAGLRHRLAPLAALRPKGRALALSLRPTHALEHVRNPRSTSAAGRAAERRALWHYRLRGYRVLGSNVWIGGNELDLVLRRGRQLVFCEVKAKAGERYGDPFEMVTVEKQRRLRRAAEAWLAANPGLAELEPRFDVVAFRGGRLERLGQAF
jgi:putative endonuclease